MGTDIEIGEGSGSPFRIQPLESRTLKLFLLVPAILFLVPSAAMADLELPVKGVVTSGIGWRVDPFGSGKLAFHRGIDIAVPVGTPVRATRKGKVVFAGERKGYGATVIVEHEDGERSLYGHNERVKVSVGEPVEAGTVVALSGNTGRSTGPHVHYERIAGGKSVPDPVPAPEVASMRPTGSDQRLELERRLDQSLDSLLKTIKSDITGG